MRNLVLKLKAEQNKVKEIAVKEAKVNDKWSNARNYNLQLTLWKNALQRAQSKTEIGLKHKRNLESWIGWLLLNKANLSKVKCNFFL